MLNTQIVPMAKRKYRLVPVGSIRILNSRTRGKLQFDDNVRSIRAVGLLKPIVVNEKSFAKTGYFELVCGEGRFLAYKALKHEKIPAEVITCDRKTALLYSLVENIARVPPNTMWFANEMKRMRDCGLPIKKISQIVGKGETYVINYIGLVEKGEDRLIKGVEAGLFSMAFAIVVAKSSSDTIQHVLMDAFDSGIITSSNVTRVRNLIQMRTSTAKWSSPKKHPGPLAYNLTDLRKDIVKVTREKEGFVREANAKENRLLSLVDGVEQLWKDAAFVELLEREGLAERVQLTGTYQQPQAQS